MSQHLTCNSNTIVEDLQDAKNVAQILFHLGKRINFLLPIWKLDTSWEKSLIFRSAQLKVSIDEGPEFLLNECFPYFSHLVEAVVKDKEVILCKEVADINGLLKGG